MKYLTQQYAPNFLLTWRPVSELGDVFTPELSNTHLSRANGQKATSESEALQRWLAKGGNLDVASLYGLKIIVGDDAPEWFSKEKLRKEANHDESGTA